MLFKSQPFSAKVSFVWKVQRMLSESISAEKFIGCMEVHYITTIPHHLKSYVCFDHQRHDSRVKRGMTRQHISRRPNLHYSSGPFSRCVPNGHTTDWLLLKFTVNLWGICLHHYLTLFRCLCKGGHTTNWLSV